MIQNISCVLHPYHCEYLRLGGAHTEEGSKYSRRYHFEMMREYEEKMKTTEYRFELGGNKEIHKLDETNDNRGVAIKKVTERD